MKKAVASFILILSTMAMAQAQNSLNSNPDAIVGTYHIEHKGHVSRVRIYKCTDGTYGAQCIYLKDSIDPKTGKLLTDVKNPNKALRNTPCNRNTILRGLRYNADKKRWEKGNIYDTEIDDIVRGEKEIVETMGQILSRLNHIVKKF